jgi:fused signal recognition particle receptor
MKPSNAPSGQRYRHQNRGEKWLRAMMPPKIRKVMTKVIPEAPHEVLLILDGSTGQNAFEQARQFTLATEVNALALTKLDGTAKGGVVIGISDRFKVPVKYIGIGEKMEDLQVFNKSEFVDSLFNS